MANPAKIWELMRMRFKPPKGQGRFDPTRELSGRPLSAAERLRLENDAANAADSYSMRGYDEMEARIAAARATRAQRMAEYRAESAAARGHQIDPAFEQQALARREDDLAGEILESEIHGDSFDLADPEDLADWNAFQQRITDTKAGLQRRRELTRRPDPGPSDQSMGFAAGGRSRRGPKVAPSLRAELERELDMVTADLADLFATKSSYRNEMGPEDMLEWNRRYEELSEELDNVYAKLRATRPRPNDAYDPDASLDTFDLPEDLSEGGFDLTDYGRRRGRGPKSGFSSSGDRWDDLSRRDQSENSLRRSRGVKAGVDRRMAQIGDQLIDLEERRIWLKPDDYARLKQELLDEYKTLEKQRMAAKRDAVDRGMYDPDDLEAAPPEGEHRPLLPPDEDFRAYRRGDPLPGRFQDRAELISSTQRQLKELLDRAAVAQYRGADEEFAALRAEAELLQKQLARYEQFPMGSPPRPLRETIQGAGKSMMDPQLGRAGSPDREWAEQYLKRMRFLPLDEPIEIPEAERETPQLIKQIMGIGGTVLDWYPDPVNYGMKLAGEIQKLPSPTVAPEMGPQRGRRREPLRQQVPDRFGRARAALEEHRRASGG